MPIPIHREKQSYVKEITSSFVPSLMTITFLNVATLPAEIKEELI